MPAGFEPRDPEFLAGIFVKRPEAAVVGGSDKNQAAGGHHGTSHAGRSRRWNPLGEQSVDYSQSDLPSKLSPVQINCRQRTPGWLLTGVLIRVPKTPVGCASRTVRHLTPFRGLDHLEDLPGVRRVDEQQVGNRIVGSASPIGATVGSRKDHGVVQTGGLVNLSDFRSFQKLQTLGARLRSYVSDFIH